jgi:AAA15 family ATPase/GTPase
LIRQIEIQNFGPIGRATVDLTPFHAFVGPNDAGKSATLEASLYLKQIFGF